MSVVSDILWRLARCFPLLCGLAPALAASETSREFRWASQGELTTLDPHVLNEGLTSALLSQAYEGLTCRDARLRLVACLATAWRQAAPNLWEFTLRPSVRFHDGSTLNVHDVVFSLERARSSNSALQVYMGDVVRISAKGSHAIVIETRAPNPILPQQLTEVRILSEQWSKRNHAESLPQLNSGEATFTTFNAMGTGPYRIERHRVGQETRFVAHAQWWGGRGGDVTRATYLPIANAATRVAALLSDEIDFVLDPPLQDLDRLARDPKIQILQGNEVRTIYLGFDQSSEVLRHSSIRSANPFKDRRVRLAVNLAIDVPTIIKTVMRGNAMPAGLIIPPQVFGYDAALDKHRPFDPNQAKRLLAEAGYPNGFQVTLDCPNNRYVNDERVCVSIAAYLARVGIDVRVNSLPRTLYFPKVQRYDTSFFLFGAGSPTLDGHYSLRALIRTRGSGEDGLFNLGGYSNPQVDARIERVATELDPIRRYELLRQAFEIHASDVGHVPLYHQAIPWAVRKNYRVTHRADNRLELSTISKQDVR